MTSNMSDLVKVKPLEWHDYSGGSVAGENFGVFYRITCVAGIWVCEGSLSKEFAGIEAAKAAAQANYESRILAALTPYEPVVEVKEGYAIQAYIESTYDPVEWVDLSEALTIRTADEVRREALEEAFKVSGEYHQITHVREAIRALIDTPAQSPDKAECLDCKGTGMRDSGGVYPWGEGILVNCDCDKAEPSPEPVDWGDDEDFHPATSENDVIYIGTRAYVATDLPDKTMSVEEAAKVLLDAFERYKIDHDKACDPIYPMLRALATQTGGE